MIIIENTTGKTRDEVRGSLINIAAFASAHNPKVWLHLEKEGREIAVNTDDDPIRPGMLAYGGNNEVEAYYNFNNYKDVAIYIDQEDGPSVAWLEALAELGL